MGSTRDLSSSSHAGSTASTAAPAVRKVLPIVLLLLAWTVLDACLNLKVPGPEPRFGFLLPSPDVSVLLLGMCVLARLRRGLPVWSLAALSVLFVLVRLFRVADGITRRHMFSEFRLFRDLSLVPEFARLVDSMLGTFGAVLAFVGLVLASGLIGWLVFWALSHAQRALRQPELQAWVVGVNLFFLALSPLLPPVGQPAWRWGAFAQPTIERIWAELDTWLEVSGYRSARRTHILAAQAPLRARRFGLEKLGGADVHLIFVESYGQTLFRHPQMKPQFMPALRRFGSALEAAGWHVQSGLMRSTTYGGKSWLAHAALASGAPIEDQVQYDVLLKSGATNVVKLFDAAGYETVQIAPAFQRSFVEYERFYTFDRSLAYAAFDYKGPTYAWAPMPDQYVLDFVRRKELASLAKPTFLQYLLVTAHTPWTPQPRYVSDWESIGDGSSYATQQPLDFGGPNAPATQLRDAYASAVVYDLRVLEDYLVRYVSRRSLVVMLGDHQPRADVTEWDPSWNVPVHVLSRDPALLAPLAGRGFVAGVVPREGSPAHGLESFLGWFMRAYSN
jgi:hypothetical protein